MAKYKIRLGWGTKGPGTGTWCDSGEFEISDPNITEFWVTKLDIHPDPHIPGRLTGVVRYEGDSKDSTCHLNPIESDGQYEVTVDEKPVLPKEDEKGAPRRRMWKLCPKLLKLVLESNDNGFQFKGAILLSDGAGPLDLVATKFTPEVVLTILTTASTDDKTWSPCKSGDCNGADVRGYWYKFEGGDDKKGGLILAKGQTERVKIQAQWDPNSAPPPSTPSPQILATRIATSTGPVDNQFASGTEPYIQHTDSNTSGKTEPTPYGVKVRVPNGSEIWCDPDIKNKAD